MIYKVGYTSAVLWSLQPSYYSFMNWKAAQRQLPTLSSSIYVLHDLSFCPLLERMNVARKIAHSKLALC